MKEMWMHYGEDDLDSRDRGQDEPTALPSLGRLNIEYVWYVVKVCWDGYGFGIFDASAPLDQDRYFCLCSRGL